MSDLYNPRYTRGGYGKFNKNKNFVSMEAGTDAYCLEDEANEMQWIQNEARADIIRHEYFSGIYKKEDNDIIISSKVFNENKKIFNSFLVKPMIANINGYFIDVLGSNGYNNQSNLIGNIDNIPFKKLNYIQLPEPPLEGNYYDFVYLEMCFAEIKFSDDIWYSGNKNNSFGVISNDMFDRRINSETNRRIQLKWNINVSRVPADFIAINTSIEGRNNLALFDEAINATFSPAKGAYHKNSTLGFWNATSRLDEKIDSDDIGLWIAGIGLDENGASKLHTTDGYSYAIPLFKVIRRNINDYYPNNNLGSFAINEQTDSFNNRPDGKFANIIYEDDIIDLRNMIKLNNISSVLHKNFENILLNQRKNETKLFTTYFGLDPIEPDLDTLLYEGCNNNSLNEELLTDPKTVKFVPGIEQEAVVLNDNTYFNKDFSVYNANIKGITTQFITNIPSSYSNEIGLYTLSDEQVRLISYIKDNNLFVITDKTLIIYPFKSHLDKFTHIAIAVRDTDLELIINNKSVKHAFLNEDMNIADNFNAKIGYAAITNYYANNCIFDEIEISNVYENKFSRIPLDIANQEADLTIDTQLSRKNYTLIANNDTYTFHKRFQSDSAGILEFGLTLPLTLTFQEIEPILYFDNESIQVSDEVSVTWNLLNNKWHCRIEGLGNQVTYNLVIISYIQHPSSQGLLTMPKLAHAAYLEKCENKTFYAVEESLEFQSHNINKLSSDKVFTNKDQFITINPYISQIGACNLLKYTTKIRGDWIQLPKNTYTNLVAIHSVEYNGKNILNDFYDNGDSFVINLTINIDDKEITIYAVTTDNASIYSSTKSGIVNLIRLEELTDYGNGTRTTFTYRSTSKILSFLQGKFKDRMYHYVFVNGQPTKVDIVIDGTFVHFTFENPPINKADIRVYLVSEYDPLRSERIKFVYEIDKEHNYDIKAFNNKSIVYHENEIFVTTDGYGIYPYQKDIIDIGGFEVTINSSSLPYKINLNENQNEPGVFSNNALAADITGDNIPDTGVGSLRFIIDNQEYNQIRVSTDNKINQVIGNEYTEGNNGNITVKTNDLSYSIDLEHNKEIPLFTFDVKALEDEDKIKDYNFYMLNKIMPTLAYLPTTEKLEFNINPVDILKSNRCNIIFDENKFAHVIAKDPLPISTNLSAWINYCIPNVTGTFLKTFNQLECDKAIPTVKGFKNCSIDNKSFYSLTTLDSKMKHINVFPFLIQDKYHILKLGIFTTYDETDKIYINSSSSALLIYDLNQSYLIKHI